MKMEQEIQLRHSSGLSKVFNNSGGPRSRVRSETIKESYLSAENAADKGFYAIDIPTHIHDIDDWLLALAKEIGWNGWDEINSYIALPEEKLMVFNELDYVF